MKVRKKARNLGTAHAAQILREQVLKIMRYFDHFWWRKTPINEKHLPKSTQTVSHLGFVIIMHTYAHKKDSLQKKDLSRWRGGTTERQGSRFIRLASKTDSSCEMETVEHEELIAPLRWGIPFRCVIIQTKHQARVKILLCSQKKLISENFTQIFLSQNQTANEWKQNVYFFAGVCHGMVLNYVLQGISQ